MSKLSKADYFREAAIYGPFFFGMVDSPNYPPMTIGDYAARGNGDSVFDIAYTYLNEENLFVQDGEADLHRRTFLYLIGEVLDV